MQEIQEQSLRRGRSDDAFEHTENILLHAWQRYWRVRQKKKIAMGNRRNKHKRISTPGKMKGYSGKEPWSCFTVRFSSGKPLFKSQYYST